MIIYLHGFRSGPQSFKAQALGARMAESGLGQQWWCEQLAWAPFDAMAQVSRVIEACAGNKPTLVGSSLGGYYATWLAERFGLRAVVVNPSVLSHITLEPYLGPQQRMYSDEILELTSAHLEQLRALEVPRLAEPAHYWLLAETGDEVLDYRQAAARYAGARQTILSGGDHSFTRWPDYLDAVIAFAGLAGKPA